MWLTGPVAPWHVGSSQTRARTRVPCIGRQTLNHCSTREAHIFFFFFEYRKRDLLSTLQGNSRQDQEGLPTVIFFLKLINLFIYFCLCWVFVSVQGPSPVAASGGHSSSRCAGFSLSRPLPLWSTGSRRAGSVVVAHGPSCSAACGIFPDRGSNPCPLR